MAAASSLPPSASAKPPLVVILGATAAGKSRLAIDLAHHFPAEVINADSMQVYKGLDILTNKVPAEERRGVPHHLLGFVDPIEEFTSKQFRDLAMSTIDDILEREKLPIVVGGTNYYIQALVSSYLMDDFLKDDQFSSEGDIVSRHSSTYANKESNAENALAPSNDRANNGGFITLDSLDDFPLRTAEQGKCSSSSEYERLKMIDPEAACRIHPNNMRKLNRYMEIYEQTGRKPSELFREERLNKWGTADTFRYNCCFLWLDAEMNVLDRFVDQRVEAMMQAGLLEEILRFYAPGADYTRGLHQAIGVAEFSTLFDALSHCIKDQLSLNLIHDLREGLPLTEGITEPKEAFAGGNDQNSNLYKEMISNAVQKMKTNTRKLVRLQKRRFNKLETHFGWYLHRLDVTEVLENSGCQSDGLWLRNVVRPAMDIVNQFLKHVSEDKSVPFRDQIERLEFDSTGDQRQLWKQFICEACESRVFIGLHQWQEHTACRAHRKRVARLKRVSGVAGLKEKFEERRPRNS